ncbi:GNAT family N-acetyltransferase [Longispora urticae]
MTDLLTAFDAEMRGHDPDDLPLGATVEKDGPIWRVSGLPWGGFIGYHRDLGGLDGAELDAFIARQRDFYAARGERFEWKTYSHDLPADLPDRLLAAGFEAEDPETVVVGPVGPLAVAADPPSGVTLREVTSPEDLARIVAMEEVVWGTDRSDLAEGLLGELAADPNGLTIVVAEADGLVVSAAWIRFGSRSFASLWGGATLAEWRGRGIYKALVAYRARLAHARGYSYLQVDCSEDSRPILERLGMTAVTRTTPYIWQP